MFAVIKAGGKQYKVQEGDQLNVEKLPDEAGQKVHFDQVLLIADETQILIGTPFIENAAVRAVVVETYKDEKVIVFKKKRRKQYKRKRGHRQLLTKLRIERIIPDLTTFKEEVVEKPKGPPKKAIPVEAEKKETVPAEVEAKEELKAAEKKKPAKTRAPVPKKKGKKIKEKAPKPSRGKKKTK